MHPVIHNAILLYNVYRFCIQRTDSDKTKVKQPSATSTDNLKKDEHPHLSYGVPHTKFGLIFEVSFLGLIVEAGKRKAKISGFEGG